jgi:hypothetical protein
MFEIINTLPLECLDEYIEQLASDDNISNEQYEKAYAMALARLQRGV